MLQILDDGRITDSNGRTVDFKNTIIIMTSNLGSNHVLEGNSDLVMSDVRSHFRPELINRIDEIIVFHALDQKVLMSILDKIIQEIEKRIEDMDIHLNLTDKAKQEFVSIGYDPCYGARPLKRLVSRTIETDLAKLIIENKVKSHDTLQVDYQNDQFILKRL